MKIAAVIPARLKSTRLENKVLLDINGKPLIQRVYEQAKKATEINDVYIATDSLEIIGVCEQFTENVVLTSADHTSGTDRIVEALSSINHGGVINVQGDEPLIDPDLLNQLALGLKNGIPVLSAMHRFTRVDELFSPDNVKVTIDKRNDALYFSRSVIPYHKNGWETLKNSVEIPSDKIFYKHIGVYAFQRDVLQAFTTWPRAVLEISESLEQLRLLDNGFKIKMIETTYESIGVDTADDLEKVRSIISSKSL